MQSKAFFIGANMEIWKDIPKYEGRYQVSDQGNVRSLSRLVLCSGETKGTYFSCKKGRLLKPGRMPSGHVSVALGKGNSQCVHKLVLLAFVGPAPLNYECLHANGIPNDNRLLNLRWGSRRQNSIDAVIHHHRGKLTKDQIKDIRRRASCEGWGVNKRLALEYGVHESTISSIKVRRHYDCFVD